MLLVSFLLQIEIQFIDFIANEIQPSIIGRNARGTRAEMRIEYLITRLGILLEQPFIECNWLLCRMNLSRHSIAHLE